MASFALNRRARRAVAARKRCIIRKGEAFGRIAVLALEDGPSPQDNRIVYRHFTRGVVDRRFTDQMLDALA